MTHLRLYASAHLSWIHPGMERLVACADGLRCARIEAHLTRCPACREILTLLCASIQAARSTSDPMRPAFAEVLSDAFVNLEARMRARGPRASLTLAQLLELYFGKKVANRMECYPPSDQNDHVHALAVPLFEVFLGSKAATAVTHQLSRTAAI